MKQKTIDSILENKVVAIVRGVDKKDIVNTAKALAKGGIKLIEVTFSQKDPDHLTKTPELISMICKELGDEVCVGAGTVMNVQQCEAAFNAGAKYMISPNVDFKVIKKTVELGAVSIPGALTPSEAADAYNEGADFVKLFPAGVFGTGYIKAVCAPLNHIPFLAVGGVNAQNVGEFLKAGVQGVGVGGNLVDVKKIAEGDFDAITALAKEYSDAIKA